MLEYGGAVDQAIAALLHDVVEDGHATDDEIRTGFGPTVARIVAGCTDTAARSGQPREPWYERKTGYAARIRTESETIHFVSAADKLHNARAILRDYRRQGEDVFAHFKADKGSTIWYYPALIGALRISDTDRDLVDELARTIRNLIALTYPADTTQLP